jgi:short-subunit dehydrogenase
VDLRNAHALVTGASGGIGTALVLALAERGAKVTLTGRRKDVLTELAERVDGTVIAADLADRDAPAQLMSAVGRVDVLVANAALPAAGLLSDFSIAEIDRALDVNLRSPIVLAKLAAEQMAARGSGHLVFVSSLAGKTASAHTSLYTATKFGIRGFALALREDMRPHGVGVSAVFPGFIRDAGMFADSQATLSRGIGTRSPEDVAAATIRAIDKNIAEVDVAPLSLRLGAVLGGVAPGLSAALQRRVGGDATMAAAAEGLRDKR